MLRAVCASILCLPLFSAAAEAAPLRVKVEPASQGTGYYLILERQVRDLILRDDRPALSRKVSDPRWLLPMNTVRNLPSGQFYVFPQCNGRLVLAPQFVGHQQREVTLRCR